MSQIKLTQTVQKGGCAAKVAAAELRSILSQVKFPMAHKELLIDGSNMDDAAIYQVTSEIALVQTLDFFTPIVDDPFLFGQIAAANSLSDIYAMGGTPKTAMAILAFPLMSLDKEVIVAVLQGASDKVAEAKANFVGGHSIDDDTLKFGLSVTGFIHPGKIWSNDRACVGDHILLIKPIGTGTATAALKRQEVNENEIKDVIQSMAQLNNINDLLTNEDLQEIHAATDLTGFGLAGHSYQMAKASQVQIQFQFDELPVFSDSFTFLQKGFLTKAHRTNKEYTKNHMELASHIGEKELILFDPQTSGGLLLSVHPSRSANIIDKLKPRFPNAKKIGVVNSLGDKFLKFE